jgi:hypothetical protein
MTAKGGNAQWRMTATHRRDFFYGARAVPVLAAVIGADQGTHVYLILSRRAHARLDLLSPRHAADNWNPALNFPQVVSSLFGVGVLSPGEGDRLADLIFL